MVDISKIIPIVLTLILISNSSIEQLPLWFLFHMLVTKDILK